MQLKQNKVSFILALGLGSILLQTHSSFTSTLPLYPYLESETLNLKIQM